MPTLRLPFGTTVSEQFAEFLLKHLDPLFQVGRPSQLFRT
jgi:hypothetical protein